MIVAAFTRRLRERVLLAAFTLLAATGGAEAVRPPYADSLGTGAAAVRNEIEITKWQRAIDLDPTRSSGYSALGRALERAKRYDEAVAAVQNGLRIHPADSALYHDLGGIYYEQEKYRAAVSAYERSFWYRPLHASAHHWLGYSLYYLGKYRQAAEHLRLFAQKNEKNFEAQYWLGLCLVYAGDQEAGARALGQAVALKPNDFEANYQLGEALSRLRKFARAIPCLEKANALRPKSTPVKVALLRSYLGVGQFAKAFRLFPEVAARIGLVVVAVYALGLVPTWWLSFRRKGALFPSLRLSFLWLMLSIGGQVAFIFLPALFPALEGPGNLLISISLPGLPLVLAAVVATRKKVWGETFLWPLRFGGRRGIALAALLLLLVFFFNVAVQTILARNPSWHRPVQKSLVLLKAGLDSNPILGFFAIGLVIPVVEEILFRGLIFESLRRWWGVRWVISVTALLFALVHFDWPFLLPLFLLGLVLGWARAKSGSLGLPILIHATNNLVATLVLTVAGPH